MSPYSNPVGRVMNVIELRQQLRRMDLRGQWVFTRAHFQILFPGETEESLKKSLARHVANGTLTRVAQGIYANPDAKKLPNNPLERLVAYLRPLDFNYISAESVLVPHGIISQMPSSYLTVMTTGRRRRYETPYGMIEFTHTKKSRDVLRANTILDPDRGIRVATIEQAYQDLKHIGRCLDLVDHDELEECIEEEREKLERAA